MEFIIFFILLIISSGLGRRLLRLFHFEFLDFKEEYAFSAALGLGILGNLVFILGLIECVYKPIFSLLLFGLGAICYADLYLICKKFSAYLLNFFSQVKIKSVNFSNVVNLKNFCVFAVFISLLITFIASFSPPIGNDSLAYRLTHIRIFEKLHSVHYIEYTRESLWPYLTEMLYLLAFTISSDVAIKLLSWSFGALLAFFIYVFGCNYLSKNVGIFAVTIFLLTPAIFTQMTYSYVDIFMAMHCFAALFSLFKYINNSQKKWILLTGVFCGFVLSIKYIGLLVVPSLTAIFIWRYIKCGNMRRNFIEPVSFLLFSAIVFCFSWYLRAYIIKGNPFYPLFSNIFGGNGWDNNLESLIGKGFSLKGLFFLPWSITMFSDRFGGEHFGVLYLLFLPMLIHIVKKKRIYSILTLFVIIYMCLWFYTDRYVNRFLFPIVAPLAIIIAGGSICFFKKEDFFSRFLKILFLFVCIFNISLLFYYNSDVINSFFKRETSDSYLSRVERTYNVAQFINEYLPHDTKILMVNEIRSYYINNPYIHLNNLINEERIDNRLLQSEEFIKEFSRYDIDYVLYLDKGKNYPWIEKLRKDLKPVYVHSFIDKEGIRFDYFLYNCGESTLLNAIIDNQ